MRIAVLIPSRNRSRMLSAVITSLRELESGENEVEYRVGIDMDEPNVDQYLALVHELNVCVNHSDCPTIGAIWNNLASINPSDIYTCMIDDAFPITPHWDNIMVAMAQSYPAFSWFEVSAPQNCGYPTCTKEWVDMVGFMGEDHYPYWFYDTTFMEMVQFITNKPVPMTQQLALYSKQEETQGFRDLDHWWGFFNATRMMRMRKAWEIVGGVPFEDFLLSRQSFVDMGNKRDREFRGTRIAEMENSRGIKSEPSSKYLLAKARAEEYLVKNGLTLWCGV